MARQAWISRQAGLRTPIRRAAGNPSLRVVLRETLLVVGAVCAYFGVRGLTEGDPAHADTHAGRVLSLERSLGLDLEASFQRLVLAHETVLDVANWTYIWLHWPLLTFTLIWLLRSHRETYLVLRNAMFVSGAIGLVVFATFPVTPPRLLGSAFVDTVTQYSYSYRVLQPPAFVNKYAAMPSLHVGWNLLAAITWWRVGGRRAWLVSAWLMPVAMGWATVATGNHWVLDVIVGASVALVGLGLEAAWRRRVGRRRTAPAEADRGVAEGAGPLGRNEPVRPVPTTAGPGSRSRRFVPP